MGRDKATLVIEAQPLWARQIGLLQELQPEAIWVSARVAPSWVPPNLEVVVDNPPSRGPLSGISAALDRTRSSHLLALAVDLPRMTSEHLGKLAGLAQPACGVIPRNLKGWEPVVAIYPKEASALASRALASQDVSMQSFALALVRQGLLRPYCLVAEETALYLNVNTPQDLV